MTALCGLVSREGKILSEQSLDGVLSWLEPHGLGTVRLSHAIARGSVVAALRTGPDRDGYAEVRSPSGELTLAILADLRLEHRADLAAKIGVPITHSDIDLVLMAYRRWGRDFPSYVYGDYAIAIFDIPKGGVMLVRDHAGNRPLMMHREHGRLAFASTAVALTGCEWVGAELDLKRLRDIVEGRTDSDRSVVRGVHALGPGMALWNDSSGTDVWRWWRPRDVRMKDLGSVVKHADRVGEALKLGVQAGLRSSINVALAGSDALTTAAVGEHMATLLTPQRFALYGVDPVVPDDASSTRRMVADALAEQTAVVVPRTVTIDGRWMLAGEERLWPLGAPPDPDPLVSLADKMLVERATTDGVRTLLSTDLGPVTFAADGPRWLVEALLKGRILFVAAEFGAWVRRRRVSPFRLLRTAILRAPKDDRDSLMLRPSARGERRLAEAVLFGLSRRDVTTNRRFLEAYLAQPVWWLRRRGRDRATSRAALDLVLPDSVSGADPSPYEVHDWFTVLAQARPWLEAGVDAMRHLAGANEVVEVERLVTLMRNWPVTTADLRKGDETLLRETLPRAVSVTAYMRWFDDVVVRRRQGA